MSNANYILIEVLHGSHVAWQEQRNLFPLGKEVLSYAKHFHCSSHATWLLWKTSILKHYIHSLHDGFVKKVELKFTKTTE